MKKDIKRVIALLAITVAAVFVLIPEETYLTEKTIITEEKAFVPTPLVIETEDEEKVSNPTPGTVVIVNPYNESQCWYGVMYINPDGEMTRVTLFDAVESDFDEQF